MTTGRIALCCGSLALSLLLTGTALAGSRMPANTSPPTVAGTVAVAKVLTSSTGSWTGTNLRYSYRWQSCDSSGANCTAIANATSSKYTVTSADAGHRLRSKVTATNRMGAASAMSNATVAVPSTTPLPPPPSSGQQVVTVDLGWAPSSNIPWNDLTQIDLFNLATTAGPALDTSNIANVNVPQWVAAAHAHPGVKALIQIGGEGNNNWGTACNDTNRAQFVQNLIGFASSNGFDGVDLDIEDGPWSAIGPPNPAMTTCIEAISNAAHAKGLMLSEDVITNWQGPWLAPSQAYVDQYQLMTFGDSLAQMQADVQATINQGLPASKFIAGVDVVDYPEPSAGCGQFASYAAQAGLKGTFVWATKADSDAGNVCTNALAGVSTTPPPPPPSDTTPPTTPGNPTQTGSTESSITVAWTGSTDNVGVTGYDLVLDGSLVGSSSTLSHTFSALACGTTHTVAVRAYDAAGNRSGLATASAATAACAVPPPPPPGTGAGLHVSGNQLLDASGKAVHLHGVNYSGTEYACIQGWGIFDGPSDDASIAVLKTWNVNVVHMGLNEDCILGINGVSAAYSGSNYMNAIVAYVNKLHANGMYAEISLMWAAPGTQQALDHPAILDADHAPAALKAIANAFKGDPNTFIGLQSEPHAITWACWKNGGSSCSVGYTALGMQGALDAVRSTGAANVVTASGIDYANNLSQWNAYKPADSLNQLMAEAHVYGGNSCSSTSCFDANYAPVAASVPMVFGETGETYDASSCGTTNISAFLNWADAHNVGYEAWTWDTWGNCLSLIGDYYSSTPANAYATYVKSHFATLP